MTAAAVAITAAFVFVGSGGASASTRGDGWKTRAVTAISKFRAVDDGKQGAFAYAYMAGATGRVYGWSHTWTTNYLNTVYALANPNGGYGLNRPYDAFNDGSVNPSTATYTVTLADHVGPILLAGYQAGVVPRDKVQSIVDLLMTTPRVPVPVGQCVAYSRQTVDAQPGYCVHNVNAGVAAFLSDAAAAGIGATGQAKLIADITQHEVGAYRPARAWWPYIADGADQDTDHDSYSADSMYRLAYWIGRESVYQHMANVNADNAASPLAHMRLTSMPGGNSSMARTGGTLWCEMGDKWTAEANAFIANPPPAAGTRLAQAAYFSARNAAAC